MANKVGATLSTEDVLSGIKLQGKRILSFIELAWEEAKALGNNYIGTEHLLLALVREGVACQVLENLNIDRNSLRTKVLETVTNATNEA
jgi:ATP-dependent Clp protease ATP-binding subunit ClpC